MKKKKLNVLTVSVVSDKSKYRKFISYTKSNKIYNGLSQETYTELTNMNCYYCDKSLKESNGARLDRIDSNKGYILQNVVPCCKRCNVAKNDMTITEYIEWLHRAHTTMSLRLSELGAY